MKVFSYTRNKFVNASPVVDVATNNIVGYKVDGSDVIEACQLFHVPPPIDWEKVRIKAAISALASYASLNDELVSASAERYAIEVADRLVKRLKGEKDEEQ